MSMDFNNAERQQVIGEPIPNNTVAPCVVNVRGTKTSQTGAQGLDLEFVVSQGPYKGRKAWKWAGFSGNGSEGHEKMITITKAFIRAMLESAYGVDPTDDSPEAMAARRVANFPDDLNGLEFVARFRLEKGEEYTDQRTGELKRGKDKNEVIAVTPDEADYQGFTPTKRSHASLPRKNGAAASSTPNAVQGGSRPAWAS